MKDTMETRIKVCPRCSRPYFGPSALSRADNETQICPDCGTREALATIGIDPEEQEEILRVMHSIMPGTNRT